MTKLKKNNSLDTIPQLALTGEDYSHIVPDHTKLSLFVQWKKGGLPREELDNVLGFEKKGKELFVYSKSSNSRYIYQLKEVKKVYVVFEPNNEVIIEGED